MKKSLLRAKTWHGKTFSAFIGIIFIISLTGCTIMKNKADLIIHNAKIYTVDNSFSVKTAVAVINGKIVAVGDEKLLEKYESENIIDMNGKPVYPGFIDGHCHFYWYGVNLRHADLVDSQSFEEILEILERHHKEHDDNWLLGRGWDQNDWPEKKFPTREKLDELYPETPVLLTRIDGHAVLANEAAMNAAGITSLSDITKGEAIVENGKMTGVFLENTADKFKDAVPELELKEKQQALMDAQKNCFAVGLTTVVDAGLDYGTIQIIKNMQDQGDLKMRMDIMLTPNEENIEKYVKRGPYKTDYLHIHSIKLYADGALGSRGACLLEPYSDAPDTYGMLVKDPEYYIEKFKLAYKYDYQVNTHTIGDSAGRFILKNYGKILRSNNNRRWRIEHAQIIHPDDFKLFGKFNIIPSIQSTHATSDMYWAEDRIGPERIKVSYAFQDLLEENGWLVNGTDFPIENINPLYTFYSAVARKDLNGYPEEGFQRENALTREQALRSMTIWAAKGSFEEHDKGSIEPGKMADFVVLDRDIMQIESDDIPGAEVVSTFVAGEQVHGAE